MTGNINYNFVKELFEGIEELIVMRIQIFSKKLFLKKIVMIKSIHYQIEMKIRLNIFKILSVNKKIYLKIFQIKIY